ncbi:hypothetical protein Tco_0512329 [Tanacetum coccineum]
MASNKSFVSSPMVDDCDSFTSDESVHSKPSVTELYVVKDEAFMVDKKYVNVTDLNLTSDEKVSISDRDDLEKKIDDVQVLDNVVCVDHNKVTVSDKAKTFVVVDSVVRNKFNVSDEDVEFAIKEVGSNNVDVNDDVDLADEDVDLAGKNVFVADQKLFLGDEDVEFVSPYLHQTWPNPGPHHHFSGQWDPWLPRDTRPLYLMLLLSRRIMIPPLAPGTWTQDFLTRWVLLRCDNTVDLYPVTAPSPIPHAFFVSQHAWHQRLRHPGDEVLRYLASSNFISYNKEKPPVLCHVC